MTNETRTVLGVSAAIAAAAMTWMALGAGEQAAGENPFSVTHSGGVAILVDGATGKTWMLREAEGKWDEVWTPLRRIDERDRADAVWSNLHDDK